MRSPSPCLSHLPLPRRAQLALVLAAGLALSGCWAQAAGVRIDDAPSLEAHRVAGHPELTVRPVDVEVATEGSVLGDFNREELRTDIARRLRVHLGAREDGTRLLRTRVELATPELGLLRDRFGPTKELAVTVTSTLPDGRDVVTRPSAVFLDDQGSQWLTEGSFGVPTLAGVVLGGVMGLGAAAAFASLWQDAGPGALSGAPISVVALLVGLALGGSLLPMLVLPVLFGAVDLVFLVWLSWHQSELAADTLAQALEVHAHDVHAALAAQPPAPARQPPEPSAPSSAAPATPPPPPPDLGGEPAPDEPAAPAGGDPTEPPTDVPLAWDLVVEDASGCVTAEAMRRELEAWLPGE